MGWRERKGRKEEGRRNGKGKKGKREENGERGIGRERQGEGETGRQRHTNELKENQAKAFTSAIASY